MSLGAGSAWDTSDASGVLSDAGIGSEIKEVVSCSRVLIVAESLLPESGFGLFSMLRPFRNMIECLRETKVSSEILICGILGGFEILNYGSHNRELWCLHLISIVFSCRQPQIQTRGMVWCSLT